MSKNSWRKISNTVPKAEISDEAASPNGEDKSKTRKNSTNNRRTLNKNIENKKYIKKEPKKSNSLSSTDESNLRTTPTRRKVGGSTSGRGDYKKISPPKLRNDIDKDSEKTGWLKKLGI